VKRLARDRLFYRDDGGVTISGGSASASRSHDRGRAPAQGRRIHICIDTTGDVKWEIVEAIKPYTESSTTT
jgi:pyruvate-formate lyase-activating enzyme